jgi:hypothetical protein
MTPVDDNTVMTDSDPTTDLPRFGVAIDDPGAYVDGLTLTQLDGAMVQVGGSVSRGTN